MTITDPTAATSASSADAAQNPVTDELRQRGQRAYDLDRKHVFHSWSAQHKIDPLTFVKAEGSTLWDKDGNSYLDFSCQLVYTQLGHQHPKIIKAIQDQAAELCTIAPQHAVEPRSEAARLIAEVAPEGMNYVFFTNGGADANEHAIRMARQHTGKFKVLSAYRSYHGGTNMMINVTGDPRRFPSDTPGDGVVHFMPAYLYRSYFQSTTEEEETERALRHLEDMILLEGPQNIAALILESIPGTAGIYAPPAGYLAGVRELTKKYGIIMICDEVMAGFGRTGAWFAFSHWDIAPDLITFAKGVNSGYVPLGGVVISDEIYQTFTDKVFNGGLTYSGHPLATAAAVGAINAMREEGLVENSKRLGDEIIGPRLREIKEKHPSVGDVRGIGCFWAIELVKNRETREPLAPYGGTSDAMGKTMAAMRAGGVIPFMNFNRFHIAPPINISDDELRRGLDAVDEALYVADEFVD